MTFLYVRINKFRAQAVNDSFQDLDNIDFTTVLLQCMSPIIIYFSKENDNSDWYNTTSTLLISIPTTGEV